MTARKGAVTTPATCEVSVVTVTFGRLDVLGRKLDSLRAQTLDRSRFELVLGVNADPETRAWLAHERFGFHVELVDFEHRLPAGAARNACAARASGALLYLSDDDAILERDTLERHLAFHHDHDAEVAAVGPLDIEYEGTLTRQTTLHVGYASLNGVNTSLPARAFARAGGFPEWLEGYGFEDVLLGYALMRGGVPTVAIRDAPVRHVGPDPRWGLEPEKARMAARNAVRAVRRYPELAFRLGVHPVSIAAKRMAFGSPVGALWRLLSSGSYRYERAFLQGALEERRHDD